MHAYPTWNWRALTVRAVAQRAKVNERTVYRHFATERELKDAVLVRLEQEAGVDLEGLDLDNVHHYASRIFNYVATFPLEPRLTNDATIVAADRRRRDALLAAVDPLTPDWTEADRNIAAGVLDVLWGVVSYERLVADWGMQPGDAIRGLSWVIELVQAAVREGHRPATLPDRPDEGLRRRDVS